MRRTVPPSSTATAVASRRTCRSRETPVCLGRPPSSGKGSTVTRRGNRPSASKASSQKARSSFRRDTLIACMPLAGPEAGAGPARQTRCSSMEASKGNSVSSSSPSACSTLLRARKGKAQSRNSTASAERQTRTSSGRFRPAARSPSSSECRPEATASGERSAQNTRCSHGTSRLFMPRRHSAPVSPVPDWRMMRLSLVIMGRSGQGCTSREGRRKVSLRRSRTSPLFLKDRRVRSGTSSCRSCSGGTRRTA